MSLRIHNLVFSMPSSESTTLFQATGTALTSSYVQMGSEIPLDGATTIFLHVYYTRGDETSISIQPRFSLRAAGTEATDTGGVENADGSVTVTNTSYVIDSTGNRIIPVRIKGRFAKIYILATGGTPTGTFGCGIHVMRE